MKVCFVVGTLGQGGAERQLLFMLNALMRRGISARVLCLSRGEYFETQIKSLGVSVEFIGRSRSRPRRLLQIVQSLRSERADVLQSTHFYTNLYTGLCGRLLGIPSIGAIRSDFIRELAAHGFWGRWQVAAPQFFLTNSMEAYRNAVNGGIPASKIEVLRNVVSPADVYPATKLSKPVTVLFVGRLDENKRPEMFVRLAEAILRTHQGIPLKFMIAGDGPLRSQLEDLATRLGMTEQELSFLGPVDDINTVYRNSHILVLTSNSEGTPNVILEAMAFGLPVVATRVGGTIEILGDGRGLLVDRDDGDGLVEAVSHLIGDTELRAELGRRGKAYVERDHSIDYLETRLPEIYSRLIENVSKN